MSYKDPSVKIFLNSDQQARIEKVVNQLHLYSFHNFCLQAILKALREAEQKIADLDKSENP